MFALIYTFAHCVVDAGATASNVACNSPGTGVSGVCTVAAGSTVAGMNSDAPVLDALAYRASFS